MRLHTWNDITSEQMNPLVSRRVIHGSNVTIARIFLAKGAVVPEHHHVAEQVSTIESGRLLFRLEGREVIVGAGDALLIPPNVPHSAEALEDTLATDVFSPPREDWIRGDDAYLRGAPTR